MLSLLFPALVVSIPSLTSLYTLLECPRLFFFFFFLIYAKVSLNLVLALAQL